MLRIQLLLLMDLILKVLTLIFVLYFHLENVIVTCSCLMEVKFHLIKLQNFPDLEHAIMQISPLIRIMSSLPVFAKWKSKFIL